MVFRSGALVVVFVALAQTAPPKAPSQNPFAGYITIDGEASPELIPDHAVWGMALRTWARTPDWGPPLSPSDQALVAAAGRAEVERFDAMVARVEALEAKLHTLDTAEVERFNDEIEMSARLARLRASDELLAALSPDGAGRVRTYVDESRRNIDVSVHPSKIDRYLQPR